MTYETPQALRTALEHRLLARSTETGIGLDRLRRRVLFERIIARLQAAEPGQWVLKGGMALEVRLHDDARLTKDIDLGLRDEVAGSGDLHERLIDALTADPDESARRPRAPPTRRTPGRARQHRARDPRTDRATAGNDRLRGMTVERAHVGEVLSLQRRAMDVEPEVEYQEIGVRSFGRGLFHKEPVSGADLGAKRVFRIEPGDLVISNVFAWEGAIAVASEAEAGMIGSHRFMTFIPADDRITTPWASWFFRSEPGLELIRQASPGSAGRNRTLAIDRFEALEIPLPSSQDQRRAAKKLDQLEAAAARLRERSDHASALIGALAVSTSARPDLDDTAKARAGWRRVALNELLELNNLEVVVETDASYEIAGVYSFGRGMFRRAAIDGSQTKYKKLHRLRSDQIVMSRLKAWEGALALAPNDLDGWFVSPEFPTFDIDREQVDAQFLAAVLTSEPFWSRLKGASKGIGARRERVNASRLLEQDIDLPPLEQQRSVAMMLQRLQALRVSRTQATRRLDALIPAALNTAFSSVN